MAYIFGDGFDCYATTSDAYAGYWDGGTASTAVLIAGRFSGGQAIAVNTGATLYFIKNSPANDAVHHITVAFRQTAALSGTTLGLYLQLLDGTNGQCAIVFRSDGAILLTSGTPAGTVLDTYTGAVNAQSTWFAFEFEVVINAATGSWAVRKNGNTSNDHALGSLNTRPGSANSYANKLQLGFQGGSINAHQFDDLLWRSDAAAVAFVGDIRCYTRLPASDASAQFSRSPTSVVVTPQAGANTTAIAGGTARYTGFTAAYDGTIGTATVQLATGYTGNMKCSVFASSGSAPTTVLGSATPIVNPATGVNTFTFGTPVIVTKGTAYYIGLDSDTSSGSWTTTAASVGLLSTTSYAAFPVASPTTPSGTAVIVTLTLTIGSNATLVNEPQQDGTISYVYDSTPGDADFYNIGAIASTPVATVAVTTRGFMQKSDAGLRTAAVQIKSGGTTVASPTNTLSSSFGWVWRTDATDPATGTAWSATGVNNAQIGPVTVA